MDQTKVDEAIARIKSPWRSPGWAWVASQCVGVLLGCFLIATYQGYQQAKAEAETPMAKVERLEFPWGEVHLMFFCPGCKENHSVRVVSSRNEEQGVWTYNDNPDAPTIRASVKVTWGSGGRVCHSYVTDGRIQFLGDCYHDLKNQTVDLPEMVEDKD